MEPKHRRTPRFHFLVKQGPGFQPVRAPAANECPNQLRLSKSTIGRWFLIYQIIDGVDDLLLKLIVNEERHRTAVVSLSKSSLGAHARTGDIYYMILNI
jgi:hypothetical protein